MPFLVDDDKTENKILFFCKKGHICSLKKNSDYIYECKFCKKEYKNIKKIIFNPTCKRKLIF